MSNSDSEKAKDALEPKERSAPDETKEKATLPDDVIVQGRQKPKGEKEKILEGQANY